MAPIVIAESREIYITNEGHTARICRRKSCQETADAEAKNYGTPPTKEKLPSKDLLQKLHTIELNLGTMAWGLRTLIKFIEKQAEELKSIQKEIANG
jgi:hypothetical protein